MRNGFGFDRIHPQKHCIYSNDDEPLKKLTDGERADYILPKKYRDTSKTHTVYIVDSVNSSNLSLTLIITALNSFDCKSHSSSTDLTSNQTLISHGQQTYAFS